MDERLNHSTPPVTPGQSQPPLPGAQPGAAPVQQAAGAQQTTGQGVPNPGFYGAYPPPGSSPYAGYYPYTPAPVKQKKRMSTGFVVFICVLCASLVFGFGVMIAGIFSHRSENSSASQPDQSTTQDFDSLDKNALEPGVDSGNNDLKISFDNSKNRVLSASEISAQSKNSVLGISVYSTDGMLQGEASGIVAGVNSKKTKTYIITCAHVVTDAEDCVFKVVDKNSREYLAAVIGYDASADVAVLSVEKVGFDVVRFGNSASVKSGENVVAIGNPGGSEFFGSVTMGVVSATDRMLVTSDSSISCIQHDAAINPGSSGGALFNVYGQVIGINYSKIALEYYEGMNFAVPSATVVEKANKIIAEGIKTHGAKIGVEYYVAASYFDENFKQLVINSIDPKSDMYAKAEKGDFIIACNGKKITDKYMIVEIIAQKQPGDEITLTIAHKNEKTGDYDTKDITVKLIEK